MSEEAIKKSQAWQRRASRAKRRENKRRTLEGATIIPSDNSIACGCYNYTTHEIKTRIVLDEITENDISLMQQINELPSQSRQIVCYMRGSGRLLIELIKNDEIKILYHPTHPELNKKIMPVSDFLQIS